ncbi:MAG: hypothetical protein COB37_02095 [Kordiimonadales bacterium]|nr:MAG: hypothetical protein COB37_02095 [Kordiimonadales bacterium]
MVQLLIKIIFRAPNYWKAFGFWRGSLLLLKVEGRGKRSSDRLLKIHLSDYPHPIYLRDRLSDRSIFWQIFVKPQYSLAEFPHTDKLMQKYNSLIAQGETPVIIDGGANIGLSARFFAQMYPKAMIIAVEPSDTNYEMLVKNTQALGSQIKPVLGGIWHSETFLHIKNLDVGDTAFQVTQSDTEGLKGYSIDSLLAAYSQSSATFIVKLDIEGSQNAVFANNAEWLKRTSVLFLELDDWLMPWSGSSMSFFNVASKIPSDFLISGEDVIWVNHLLKTEPATNT